MKPLPNDKQDLSHSKVVPAAETTNADTVNSNWVAAADVWSGFDNGQRSVLHALFARHWTRDLTFAQANVYPIGITATIFFLVPFLIEVGVVLSANPRPYELTRTMLRDVNLVFAVVVTLPTLVRLLLTDRSVLRTCIASLFRRGVLDSTPERLMQFRLKWERYYRRINIAGQLAGIPVALLAVWLNYYLLTLKYTSPKISMDGLTIQGYLFLFWQIPALFIVGTLCTFRGILGVIFLLRLFRNCSVRPNLFHPDNCGGFRAVGRYTLRNQCALAVCGFNVLLMIGVMLGTYRGSPVASGFIFTGVVLYVLVAPFVFMGPLLPLHKHMASAKESQVDSIGLEIQTVYETVKEHIEQQGGARADTEPIERLFKLSALVRSMSTWPVDTAMVRNFLGAYTFPTLGLLASLFGPKIVSLL